jgi:hypothetical protein
MERSVDGMKLQREKCAVDFIPYNLPELFQGCEKLNKCSWARNCVLFHHKYSVRISRIFVLADGDFQQREWIFCSSVTG